MKPIARNFLMPFVHRFDLKTICFGVSTIDFNVIRVALTSNDLFSVNRKRRKEMVIKFFLRNISNADTFQKIRT